MTHTRKRKDGKKARKVIFRRMKQLMKTVEGHALNYHSLLEERWQETDWNELETQIVLDRMQNILDQLPLMALYVTFNIMRYSERTPFFF